MGSVVITVFCCIFLSDDFYLVPFYHTGHASPLEANFLLLLGLQLDCILRLHFNGFAPYFKVS